MPTLVSLPSELLDVVTSYIESPSDLLSLALTSKLFNAVVIPSHLWYRHIACDIRRTDLWEHLSKSPALASRILSVEIISEPTTGACVPPAFQDSFEFLDEDEDLDDCVANLCAALRAMPRLRAFRGTALPARGYDDLWTSLRESCPHLRAIEANLNLSDEIDTPKRARELAQSSLFDFSNLTEFLFSSLVYNVSEPFEDVEPEVRSLARLTEMLTQRCPDLTDLKIVSEYRTDGPVIPYDASPLLTAGQWPHLRSLTLGSRWGDAFISRPYTDIISTFVGHHPGLQALSIFDTDDDCLRDLPATSLPNLRFFNGQLDNVKSVLSRNKCDPPRPLKRLQSLTLTHVKASLTNLVSCRDTLTHLAIVCGSSPGDDLAELARTLPNLQQLKIERDEFEIQKEEDLDNGSHALGTWIAELSEFQSLTHLVAFPSFSMPYLLPTDNQEPWLNEDGDVVFRPQANDIVQRFANAIPTLRWMQLIERVEWIEILRNEQGEYQGWQAVEGRTRDLLAKEWLSD